MELTPDEDEQRIFDTMNSLGKPLSTTDLLKNYFFEDGNVNAYERMWKSEFERDDATRTYWNRPVSRRRAQTMIDVFFGAALQIMVNRFTAADGSTLGPEERKRMSSGDRMMMSYRTFIDQYCRSAGTSLYEARRAVLREIITYAGEFRAMFGADITSRPVYSDPAERLAVFTMDMRLFSPIPYLLYLRREVRDDTVRNEMFRILESYLVRRVVANAGAARYGSLFGELLRRAVRTADALAGCLSQLGSDLAPVSDVRLQQAFLSETGLSNAEARSVLYLLETGLFDVRLSSFDLRGLSAYTLEHLMPVRWEDKWPPQNPDDTLREKRNHALQTIGNMAIAADALNKSMSNSDWHTKLHGNGRSEGLLRHASGLVTTAGATDCAVWDVEQIRQRGHRLYEMACRQWPALPSGRT